MRSNLTINAGLRWEYFSPYTEKYNQMSNLDFAPGFTAVAVVLPGQTGPYSGAFPDGFIKPDYKLFSPRIGIAWKPWKSKQIVVRSGYGIYFNGSVYGTLASRLIGQPPFASTTQLFQSTAIPLSLENGFPPTQSDVIANTFVVDKNYHPGYAQNWTTSIQETFGRSYVVQIAYNGIKGTDLDVLQLPNRSPLGTPQLQVQSSLLIPYATQFTYDNSLGNSTYNALQLATVAAVRARHVVFASLHVLESHRRFVHFGWRAGADSERHQRGASAFADRSAAHAARELQLPVADQQHADGNRCQPAAGMDVGGNLNVTSGRPFTAT